MRRWSVVGAIVAVLAAGGCGSNAPSGPGANPQATVTQATTTAPAATAVPATTAVTSAAATCDPDAFLPLLQRALDDPALELRIVRVEVRRCRNGYAQVFAVPDDSVCEPGVGHCYDTEQVFLRQVAGAWQIVTSGTGISCADGSVPADVCEALGAS